jgi:hypothetical protein
MVAETGEHLLAVLFSVPTKWKRDIDLWRVGSNDLVWFLEKCWTGKQTWKKEIERERKKKIGSCEREKKKIGSFKKLVP